MRKHKQGIYTVYAWTRNEKKKFKAETIELVIVLATLFTIGWSASFISDVLVSMLHGF